MMKSAILKSTFTKKTVLRLVVIWGLVALFLGFGRNMLGPTMPAEIASIAFLILLAGILIAAFGVVREADALAHKLGEPYGTLILTLSVVSIEVILIAAVLLGPGENPTIGKDSIFSVMMIIMNLVMGLCLFLGAAKFGEQSYNKAGTQTYLGMIILLGGLGLVLPNYIVGLGVGTMQFTPAQAITISIAVIFLYALFLFYQMGRYNYLYVQPPSGNMEIRFSNRLSISETNSSNSATVTPEDQAMTSKSTKSQHTNPLEVWLRSLILLGMILPIVILSHDLAIVVDYGIAAAGLPLQLGGILIAVIVFTPESITAIRAALNNEFQRAINLCHGAFVSTVGLTIPAVLLIGIISGKTILFGMSSTETVLFLLTILLSMSSFAGHRTNPISGFMHLILFVVFMLLVFNP